MIIKGNKIIDKGKESEQIDELLVEEKKSFVSHAFLSEWLSGHGMAPSPLSFCPFV